VANFDFCAVAVNVVTTSRAITINVLVVLIFSVFILFYLHGCRVCNLSAAVFKITQRYQIHLFTALVITLFPGGPGRSVTSKSRALSMRFRLPFAE